MAISSLSSLTLFGCAFLLASLAAEDSAFSDPYRSCGQTRQCYGSPNGCEASRNCRQLISYTEVQNGTISYELFGSPPEHPTNDYSNNFWIGFGASVSGNMNLIQDNASVVRCAHFSNGSNEIVAGYNTKNWGFLTLSERQKNIEPKFIGVNSGTMHCGFSLLVEHEVQNGQFNLNKPYTLLLSSGIYNESAPNKYDILWQMAPPVPITSDGPIVFACGPNCPALPLVLRGSFGFPQGCTVGTNCQMEASWGCRKNTDKIYLSVAGVYQSKDNDQTDEFYVAFGLNQLAQMAYAYVIECVRWKNATSESHRGSKQIDMFTSYNGERGNDRINSAGVTLVSSLFTNGKLHCEYDLSPKLSVTGVTVPNGQLTDYDLTQPFHLLLASGPLINDTDTGLPNKKAYHYGGRAASSTTFVLGGDKTVYDHCGGTRKCFGVPINCVDSKNCRQLLTYEGQKEGESFVSMTLHGAPPNEESATKGFWIGFGSSMSGKMDDTAVIQCVRFPDGDIDVLAAYNSPNYRAGQDGYDLLTNKRFGVDRITGSFEDGIIECSFTLEVVRNLPTQHDGHVLIDLTEPYYLVLGSGILNDNNRSQIIPGKHKKKPVVFPPVALACGNKCGREECRGRTCFGNPASCEHNADGHCDTLLSWKEVPGRADVLDVALHGEAPNTTFANNFWISFGLNSGEYENKMAGSAFVQCSKHLEQNVMPDRLVASFAHTQGYNYTLYHNLSYGISNQKISFEDGRLACSFYLDVEREMYGLEFDMKKPYFISLGSGWVDNQTAEGLPGYRNRKHVKTPIVSSSKIIMACLGSNCTVSPTTVAPPSPTGTPSSKTSFFCLPNDCSKARLEWNLSKKNSSRLSMKLSGKQDAGWNGQFYVAVGFTRAKGMRDASVIDCVRWQKDGSVSEEVLGSYNRADKKDNIRIDNDGLFLQASSFNENNLTCEFEMDFVRTLRGVPTDAAGQNLTFDLTEPIFILLAVGKLTQGSEKDYHQANKAVSDKAVVITDGEDALSSNYHQKMKKAHAIMMVLAWLLFASFGILMARQTRDMWPLTLPFGLKIWFHAHRTSMVLVTVLTISAFVIIFVQAGGWVDTTNHPLLQSHAVIGTITFSLAMIQPFVALFRPHPGTAKRPVFNYFHRTLGLSTHVLSIVTMMLGTQLNDRLEGLQGVGFLILASFLINVLLQVALEIYKNYRASNSKAANTSSFDELARHDSMEGPKTSTVPVNSLDPNDPARYGILVVNWLQIFLLSILMVVFIAAV